MRPILIVPVAAGVALAVALALPATAATKAFNLSGFEAISTSAGVKVILKQGPFSISAEEPDGDFSKLLIETRGSTLVVSRRNSDGWSTQHYVVTVTAPNINKIDVSAGAHLEGAQLRLTNLSVGVSSGAHAQLAGECRDISIEVSSGAHFDGSEMKCQTASASASSGAHADAFASASAKGDASSGAHVSFRGSPKQVERHTSSGGSVQSR